jgi:hypothetical protein
MNTARTSLFIFKLCLWMFFYLLISGHVTKYKQGRAMAQAVSRRPLTADVRVRSWVKSMWDLWWTKWHWDRFLSPSTTVFPCRFHSTGAPLHGKTKKLITGLHNKPQGCGASLASTAGPFTKKKSNRISNEVQTWIAGPKKYGIQWQFSTWWFRPM